MSYHVGCFMAFTRNDQCYGYNRRIVCDNVPILCTYVHLGMVNNIARVSFHFRQTKKLLFHFPSPKNGVFCEATTK
jgi:hypothetical protein